MVVTCRGAAALNLAKKAEETREDVEEMVTARVGTTTLVEAVRPSAVPYLPRAPYQTIDAPPALDWTSFDPAATNAPPVASFTRTPDSGDALLHVEATDTSQSPDLDPLT